MKRTSILFLILTIAFSYPQLNAQEFVPQPATISHNGELRPCLLVNLDPEPKTLKKAWKDYLKDEHDIKLKGIGFLTNKDLLSAEKVIIEAISDKEMDFYTHIVEDKNGSAMKVFAAFGYDIYIDEQNKPEAYAALKSILEDFLKTYLPKYHEELIEATRERIEELSDERDDIQKEIKDDEKEIKKLKKEIKRLNKRLGTNQSELATIEAKLKAREAKLERVRKELENM